MSCGVCVCVLVGVKLKGDEEEDTGDCNLMVSSIFLFHLTFKTALVTRTYVCVSCLKTQIIKPQTIKAYQKQIAHTFTDAK